MATISQIIPREILDSRGNPTIETTVILSDNTVGTASVPSGASTGAYEAKELRDGDTKRFRGMGVLKAIENIRTIIAPKLAGKVATNQAEVDNVMITVDGTDNKSTLGANAILSVSMATARAAAKSVALPLFQYLHQFIKTETKQLKIPSALFNVINGGKHADGNVDFQEFIITPAMAIPYSQALQMALTIYESLKKTLRQNNYTTLVGDEGGFAPNLTTNQAAFALLKQACEGAGYRPGFDVFFGIDVASNSFFKNGKYALKDHPAGVTSAELIALYENIHKEYKLLYLEDPLSEDDWDGWVELYTKLSQQTLIVGDDLIATNPYRLQTAITKKAISAIIVKPNQIGTIIEALAVVGIAHQAGIKVIVSHRSGETNDDFIADFAVAACADYVKFGAPARGERVAKYNRLLQIEKELAVV